MSAKDTIDARPETISSLITFSSNPAIISVPTYQRSYQWDQSRVLDILRLSDPDDRSFGFIGTMVFVQNHDKSLEVVDGQQRLISIILALCAFRDFLQLLIEDCDDEDVRKMLEDMKRDIQSENLLVSKSYSSTDETPRLVFARSSYDLFNNRYLKGDFEYKTDEEAVKELRVFEKNYKQAKDYFIEKYDKARKSTIPLLNMRIEKLKGLVVNTIYITKPEYSGEVFESINGTGVNLKLSELVKNYILRNVSVSAAEKKWNEIEANCDHKNEIIENIIKYDWQSRHDITDDFEIFRSIRNKVDNVEAYLDKLLRISKIFSFYLHPSPETFKHLKLSDNSNDKNHIIKFAGILRLLKVKQFLRLLIALDDLREGVDIKSYSRLLELIVNFQIRAKISGIGTNQIDALYSSYAKTLQRLTHEVNSGEVPKNKIRSRVTTELFDHLHVSISRLSQDDTFEEAFSKYGRTRSTKDLFKYLLSKIENHLQNSELIVDVKDNTITLEEIYPQTPSKEWENMDCTTDDIYKIGNATILTNKDNRKASNDLIDKKFLVYSESNLKINRQLTSLIEREESAWSTSLIQERGNTLAKLAVEIWKI